MVYAFYKSNCRKALKSSESVTLYDFTLKPFNLDPSNPSRPNLESAKPGVTCKRKEIINTYPERSKHVLPLQIYRPFSELHFQFH